MSQGKDNEFYAVVQEVGAELAERHQEAEEAAAKVTPYGQKRVTPSEFWAAASANPRVLKQMLAQDGGREQVVKAIREGKLRKG